MGLFQKEFREIHKRLRVYVKFVAFNTCVDKIQIVNKFFESQNADLDSVLSRFALFKLKSIESRKKKD